ncbi:MFS transporter [Paenibacillus yanchengensis]|uniref:MFS transporter n=1 Tax=Paenibacillus yanchengensis TaxID=2035833 RepID=A0ABW4YLS6_9BACL
MVLWAKRGKWLIDRFSRHAQVIPPEKKLSRDAVITLIIHCCFQIGASMSGLFLNLYLWRLTEDLVINGLYNIIMHGVTPLAFAVGGYLAKKTDRMVTYRFGIVMIAIFYLCVVIAKEQVVNYYILFAICNGIAAGFYWTGYLILQYDVSTEQNRIRFLAINLVVFNTAGLAGPALAGYIIQRSNGLTGYIIIFSIAFVMFVIAAIVSFKIPKIVSTSKTYYLKFAGILMRRDKLWLKSLYGFFFVGLFQGTMLFLPNILLFRAVGREDWVGYLGMLFATVTVLIGYVISRKGSAEQSRRYMFLSAAGVTFGSSLLLWDVSLWTVVIFMILFSICNPLALNTLSTYYYKLIAGLPLRGQLRVEAVVMREVFINLGRIVSIGLLILFARNTESIAIAIILFATAVSQFMILFCIQHKQRKQPTLQQDSR